eukprot:6661301-Karenia_brevis.AAC.1
MSKCGSWSGMPLNQTPTYRAGGALLEARRWRGPADKEGNSAHTRRDTSAAKNVKPSTNRIVSSPPMDSPAPCRSTFCRTPMRVMANRRGSS